MSARLGSWFYTHFRHITGAVCFVTDKIHGFNLGPVSSAAGLVSCRTHIADAIFEYGHAILGWDPLPSPYIPESSPGVPSADM